MAKITAQNLIDMGFTGEMFGPEADALEGFFEDVIDEQAADLAVRLGDIYASADADTARAVRTAEKALCAAELVRRRIVQAMSLAVPNGEQSPIKNLQTVRREFLDEAQKWIDRLSLDSLKDSAAGFAFGAAITSHFDGDAA